MNSFECELCGESRPDTEQVVVMHDDARMSICGLCCDTTDGIEEVLHDNRGAARA